MSASQIHVEILGCVLRTQTVKLGSGVSVQTSLVDSSVNWSSTLVCPRHVSMVGTVSLQLQVSGGARRRSVVEYPLIMQWVV